jgi:hypothetical protein
MTVNEIREWLQLRLDGSQGLLEASARYMAAATDLSPEEIQHNRGYNQAVQEETWFLERLLMAMKEKEVA